MGFAFSVINLGCKVNRVESDGFCRALADKGGSASTLPDADVVVVNTCTVTAAAEKKARKSVRHALSSNPHAIVVVTGCASAIHPDEFGSMSNRVHVVPKALALDYIGSLAVSSNAADFETSAGESLPEAKHRRARVGLKVQDGCANACTYCIVHVARGPERSEDAGSIVEEAKALADEGVAEIVLTGINLGRYSWDGITLAGLLEALLAEELPCRFRLSSIEPNDVDDALVDVLACSGGKVCRHLHLPLQAGSDKVLREMDRKYSAGDFLETIERIKRAVPSISLTTDVICGFPGETDDEFEQTVALCRQCGFSRIHVFPYSEREGTPAAERGDQIPNEVRTRRAERLRGVAAQLRLEDRALRAGTTELAVVESEHVCTTESYHDVEAPQGARIGSLVEVTL